MNVSFKNIIQSSIIPNDSLLVRKACHSAFLQSTNNRLIATAHTIHAFVLTIPRIPLYVVRAPFDFVASVLNGDIKKALTEDLFGNVFNVVKSIVFLAINVCVVALGLFAPVRVYSCFSEVTCDVNQEKQKLEQEKLKVDREKITVIEEFNQGLHEREKLLLFIKNECLAQRAHILMMSSGTAQGSVMPASMPTQGTTRPGLMKLRETIWAQQRELELTKVDAERDRTEIASLKAQLEKLQSKDA